jgi:hypothetical protein
VVAVGCKSSGAAADGAAGAIGSGGSAGVAGSVGSGGSGGTGTGGATAGDGGAGSNLAGVKDCLPDCIVNLRRECERPNLDAGSCVVSVAADGTETACFSGGAIEQRLPVPDGGGSDVDYVFLKPDRSVCYRVHIHLDASGEVITYSDPASNVVGVLTSASTGSTATCFGSPVTVPASDPSCRMLDVVDCPAGTCP